MGVAIVGDTVTMKLDVLQDIVEDAVMRGAEVGVKAFRDEQMKSEDVSTSKAANELDVTVPTILNYIQNGHRSAGKLPAREHGRVYKINRFDLKIFKQKIKTYEYEN